MHPEQPSVPLRERQPRHSRRPGRRLRKRPRRRPSVSTGPRRKWVRAPAQPMPLDPPIRELDGHDLAWALARSSGSPASLDPAWPTNRCPPGVAATTAPPTRPSASLTARRPTTACTPSSTSSRTRSYGSSRPKMGSPWTTPARSSWPSRSPTLSPARSACASTPTPSRTSPPGHRTTDLALIEQAALLINQLAKRIEDAVLPPAREKPTSTGDRPHQRRDPRAKVSAADGTSPEA